MAGQGFQGDCEQHCVLAATAHQSCEGKRRGTQPGVDTGGDAGSETPLLPTGNAGRQGGRERHCRRAAAALQAPRHIGRRQAGRAGVQRIQCATLAPVDPRNIDACGSSHTFCEGRGRLCSLSMPYVMDC